MPSSIPPFDQSLPMALLRARDAAMRHFRPVLNEAELTEQQWRVIRALNDAGALEISALAKSCHILLPSMSGIVKRLEARGLVQRSANTQDQRSSLVALTPAARVLIQEISPKLEAGYRHIETALGRERLAQLYSLLAEVEQNLG